MAVNRSYHAYLEQPTLPGPEPTFADFVGIRRLQEEMESSFFDCTRRPV